MSELEKHHTYLTPYGDPSDSEAVRREDSLAQLAYEFSVEINDILNAAALRLALLRWQPNGARSEGDIARLTKIIDQAANLVRWLQDRAFTVLEDRNRDGLTRAARGRNRRQAG